MKKIKQSICLVAAVAFVAITLTAQNANATEIGSGRPFGLGIVLGDPTGISAKVFLGNDSMALQASLGSGWWSHSMIITFDFLWHPAIIAENQHFVLPFYIGVGPVLGVIHNRWDRRDDDWDDDNHVALWARMPIGIAFLFNKVAIEAYAELAPAMLFVPGFDFGFFGGIGARYYF